MNNSITVQLMSAYTQYVDNGYPQDPAIYVIRACGWDAEHLKNLKKDYIVNLPSHMSDDDDRFLLFTVQEDDSLSKGNLVFGPQTINIKWSE